MVYSTTRKSCQEKKWIVCYAERVSKQQTTKSLPVNDRGAKRKAVSGTIAGNIALRWSAGLRIQRRIYKHSAPLEPGRLFGCGISRAVLPNQNPGQATVG